MRDMLAGRFCCGNHHGNASVADYLTSHTAVAIANVVIVNGEAWLALAQDAASIINHQSLHFFCAAKCAYGSQCNARKGCGQETRSIFHFLKLQ